MQAVEVTKTQPAKPVPEQAVAGTAVPLADRAAAYDHILNLEQLSKTTVAVIGTGSVGRLVVLYLAAMGIGRVLIVDHDKVEARNLGSQGWKPDDIGGYKVEVLAKTIREINPEIAFKAYPEKFRPEHLTDIKYVISCVDDMDVRMAIFEAATKNMLELEYFADARTASELASCYFVTDAASAKAWRDGWYPQAEVFKESCTTRSTIHCAGMAATMLVQGFTMALRRMPMPLSVDSNLRTFEMCPNYTLAAPEPVVATGKTLDDIADDVVVGIAVALAQKEVASAAD